MTPGIFDNRTQPLLPIGTIIYWMSTELPDGWLADNQLVYKSEYNELYQLWAGIADENETQFRIPDLSMTISGITIRALIKAK